MLQGGEHTSTRAGDFECSLKACRKGMSHGRIVVYKQRQVEGGVSEIERGQLRANEEWKCRMKRREEKSEKRDWTLDVYTNERCSERMIGKARSTIWEETYLEVSPDPRA